MKRFQLKKGLDVPILGAPRAEISDAPEVRTYGVLGDDYIGLKPRILVAEGDIVGPGTPVMIDKTFENVNIVSPVAGRIKAINRGARRKLISVEIEAGDGADAVDFSAIGDVNTPEGLVERLCAAGLWTSLRTRPYSKVPDPATRPAAIFVTAMDSEPLSFDPAVIINDSREAFCAGLEAIQMLSDGATYLCHGDGADIPGGDIAGVEAAAFAGPHPAGLAGTHIHFLQPPKGDQPVWTISYQDVIIIGRLLKTGQYDGRCVISLAGPACTDPRPVRTIMGASLMDLSAGSVADDIELRLVSGSPLSGRAGDGPSAYLGRYARQVTVLEEDRKQIPMGWIRPMGSKYAVQPVLASMFSKRLFGLTTNLHGAHRAMVPTGTFEELMPQDYLPTQLLRALLVMDTDQAQLLGALELDEEDLGVVGFACPAKYDYGQALRDCLTKIEKEG